VARTGICVVVLAAHADAAVSRARPTASVFPPLPVPAGGRWRRHRADPGWLPRDDEPY